MEKVESRKLLKKRAKAALSKHYWMYLAICLLAALLGAECKSSLDIFHENPFSVFETAQNDIEEAKKGYNEQMNGISEENSDSEEIDEDAFSEDEVDAYDSEEEYDGSLVDMLSTDNTNFLGGIKLSDSRANDAINAVLKGNIQEGKNISDQITQEHINRTKDSETLGRSRGVLAKLVNNISSGKYVVTLFAGIYTISKSSDVTMIFFVLLSLTLVFLFYFLIKNTFIAISRRYFLEGRMYDKIPINRFLIFLKAGKWIKVAWTMFLTTIFLVLWSFTIVGVVIKAYSYSQVPYIVAENPDIGALKAITLSRKMMKGHKWERFVLQLSFIPWDLLCLITFGLSDLFYTNSYRIATYTEYYCSLRSISKNKKGVTGVELLNDVYLYEKADIDTLQLAYADVMEKLNEPEVTYELKGFRGFIARNFGITFFMQKEEAEYEKHETAKVKLREYANIVKGLEYPKRLFTIPEKPRSIKLDMLYYMRHYSVWSLILMFFTFSMIGWIWEVALHFITDGEFVNRGVLHGPWLPIYGIGGLLMLILLTRFRSKPLLEFITAVILSGFVEYFMGLYLEVTHNGLKWWDYSGYFLNLHGRICAEGLLVFGLGGIAIVYIIAPLLDNVYRKIKFKFVVPVCAVLILFYIGDQLYSAKSPNTGAGVTTVPAVSAEVRGAEHSK